MLAVAALLALVGAMFVAYVPAGANHNANKLGNVTHNTAQCNDGALQGKADAEATTYDTQVQVYAADSLFDDESTTDTVENEGNQPGLIDLTSDLCKAEDTSTTPATPAVNNGAYFSITPNGTEKPIITKLNPTASIRIGDSDGIVKAGTDLVVTISLKTVEPATTGTPTLDWVRVSGELDNPTQQDDEDGTLISAATWTPAGLMTPTGESVTAVIEIPEGTTEREYTVSARFSYNHDGVDSEPDADPPVVSPDKKLTPTAKFIVGDPGMNAASATLSLGNSHDEDPLTSASDVVAEDGVEPAVGGDVWLKVATMNSLGKKANSDGLSTLTVIAPGATLSAHAASPAGTPMADELAADGGSNSLGITNADLVKQTMFIKVGRAGSPAKPGTVTVYAIVIGTDGAARTNDLDVVFTGSAAVVVLGDDVSVGKPAEGEEAMAEISLAANDAGGADAKFGTVAYKVTDADGEPISQAMVKAETSTVGSSTEKTTDDNKNKQVVLITVDDTAKPGVYTVEASLTGVEDSEDTATVTVSGAASNIDLSASSTSSSTIGDVITVTAMISDEDGNAISDGQLVTFDVSGKGLVQIGSDASTGADGMAGFQSKTKGGSASALFTVTGEGTAVVSAVIGSQTAVVVIVSTAGSTAAMEDADPSLSDLSGTSGLVSYSGPDTTASALMTLLAGRASAIWLSNNGSWVLYANVDGAMVPGSTDFAVTSGDVLYISN